MELLPILPNAFLQNPLLLTVRQKDRRMHPLTVPRTLVLAPNGCLVFGEDILRKHVRGTGLGLTVLSVLSIPLSTNVYLLTLTLSGPLTQTSRN